MPARRHLAALTFLTWVAATSCGDSTSPPTGGEDMADLSVSALSESADPIALGESVTYQATIQNIGPDDVTDAMVSYLMFGDALAGPLLTGCTENTAPPLADVQIDCAVGQLDDQGSVQAPSATFEPQAPGTYTVSAFGSSPTVGDPATGNNTFQTTLTVTAPQADLRVDRFVDTPDPVAEGNNVTYEVDVIAAGAGTAVDGAVLQLLVPGTAQFVSSTLSCADITGGVECALGTLQPDVLATEQVVMSLQAAGVVSAEARIMAPAGIDDPNSSNNSLLESTTVTAGPRTISVGQVLEVQGPTVVSGEPPDTAWYTFETTAVDQTRRIHLSRITEVNGFGQLLLYAGSVRLFPPPPSTLGGRATDLSSANEVLVLGGAGEYRLGIAGSEGTYRLGLGTGQGRLDKPYGPQGTGVVVGVQDWDGFVDMRVVGDETVFLESGGLTRYDASGAPVASFGSGGAVDLVSVLSGRGAALAVQPDGKIVVAAYSFTSPYPWIIARFESDGTLDPTFSTDGMTQVNLGGNRIDASPKGVGFQQNGSDLDIVVAGNAGDLQNKVGVIRLNPDGSLDTGFGTSGIVFENRGFTPTGMGVQSDGKILVRGSDEIIRYTSAGVYDTGFATGGLWDLSLNTSIQGLHVLPDDDILVLGEILEDAFIQRLTPDGAYDPSFGGGGQAIYDFGLADRFLAATQDAAGQLVVVGHQETTGGDKEFLVTRMTAAGLLDMDFGHAGYVLENRVDQARAVGIDTQGRILVGGQEVSRVVNGPTKINVTRHLPD